MNNRKRIITLFHQNFLKNENKASIKVNFYTENVLAKHGKSLQMVN